MGPRPCSDRFGRFLEGSLILAYKSCRRDSLDTVERWSGPLLLLGGGMIVVASIIHPQGTTSQFVLQSLWVPAHIFEFAGWTTILLGLVGWYSRFSTRLGRLGTLGFLLFFLALATGVGFPFGAISSSGLTWRLTRPRRTTPYLRTTATLRPF